MTAHDGAASSAVIAALVLADVPPDQYRAIRSLLPRYVGQVMWRWPEATVTAQEPNGELDPVLGPLQDTERPHG